MQSSYLVFGGVHTSSWRTPRLQSLIYRGDQPHRACGRCHCASPLTRFCCQHPDKDPLHNYRFTTKETREGGLPHRGKPDAPNGVAWTDILDRNLSTKLRDSSPSSDNESMVFGSNEALIKHLRITDDERESLYGYLSQEEEDEAAKIWKEMMSSSQGPPAKRSRRRQDDTVISDPKEMESWVWQTFDEFCARL